MSRALLILIAALCLSACAPAGGGDPAPVVEQYLTAKVNGDADAISRLLCSAMEADLNREVSSFSSVTDASIKDMTCQRREGEDVVECSGQIVAAYGTENTTFPLTAYRVVQEDGEWKWCGEAG